MAAKTADHVSPLSLHEHMLVAAQPDRHLLALPAAPSSAVTS
jgi:hypothetical protein